MSLLQELPLHKQLFKALDKLAFTEATEVQARAIPAALAGKDVMVSAKTGSGKTAAFVLPMLDRLLATDAPGIGSEGLHGAIGRPGRDRHQPPGRGMRGGRGLIALPLLWITGMAR